MTGVLAVLHDRRRAQRGSVLSGVLIITAFIAILSGALMTTLSTNFLLSQDLMTKTLDQATVHSSVELAIDSLQNVPLSSACPNLAPPPALNGLSSSVNYLSCALVTDSSPAAIPIANPEPVRVDGSYVSFPSLLPGTGNEYLVTDSTGRLFAYPFGNTAPAWTVPLGGTPTASPAAMAAGDGEIANFVPTADGSGNNGVSVVEQMGQSQASLKCTMATNPNAAVTASPAASRNPADIVYFGDGGGTLYAFDASAAGTCGELQHASVGDPVVAGPVVFPGNTSKNDRLFFVTSDSGSSSLVQYRYSASGRSLASVGSPLPLPAGKAIGMDVDTTNLPARLAITFAGGTLALVQISSSFNMTLVQTASVPGGGLTKPPSWCLPCLAGGDIGVAGPGGVFIFDSSLSLRASFTGAAIASAPTADPGGDWFAGGADGTFYELRGSGTMVVAEAFPVTSGAITSSPIVNLCPAGLCAYFGADSSNAYLIPFDQRDIALSACVASQGSCAPGHTRLWAHVVVGASGNHKVVRVVGFSYYSP